MKNKRIYVKEAKDGQINKLRRRIHKLEKENDRLKSEISTLEQFRRITSTYIDNKLDGVSVENVIKGVDKKLKMSKIVEDNGCVKCGSEVKTIPYLGGIIRLCSNIHCSYKETIKNEAVRNESNDSDDLE